MSNEPVKPGTSWSINIKYGDKAGNNNVSGSSNSDGSLAGKTHQQAFFNPSELKLILTLPTDNLEPILQRQSMRRVHRRRRLLPDKSRHIGHAGSGLFFFVYYFF